MPRKSTGAPTTSPRVDSLNTIDIFMTSGSGFFSASWAFGNSLNWASAGGRRQVRRFDRRLEGEAADQDRHDRLRVVTLMPLASRVTSMPLACQKRVFVLTNLS